MLPVHKQLLRARIRVPIWYSKRLYSSRLPFLQVSEEVEEAIHAKKPVVALETTIYTHGFPYPENIALSSLLESRIRVNGAVPATVGILNGVARVGMSPEEIIELLESAGRPSTIKVSRRDIGRICSSGLTGSKLNGGTTISGTLVLAHLAGIKVFATGGLGGVHKGGENSMDVSADLTELGRTPMALVSSGCKSFLDIPRTLEYLETQGVGVGTFADGREGPVDFPAFWTRDSGIPSPTTIENEKEAAAILYAQLSLPLSSGLLFTNPIAEDYSLSKELMDEVMAQAVSDAADAGMTGSKNTPFVLERIRGITNNATIAANRALVESNVIRGAKVAVELAKLEMNEQSIQARQPQILNATEVPKPDVSQSIDVLVAGSVAMDISCDYNGPGTGQPSHHTSNPAHISHSLGGVGQNIATASHYFGAKTQLCTVVGRDPPGKAIVAELQRRGMNTDALVQTRTDSPTAQYIAINDAKKDLVLAMADMRILEENHGAFDGLWKPQLERSKPRWVVVDGNWNPETLREWTAAARTIGAKVAYEPVSVEKSTRLLHEDWKSHLGGLLSTHVGTAQNGAFSRSKIVDMATPNTYEVAAMSAALRSLDAWLMFQESMPKEDLERFVKSQFEHTFSLDVLAAALASVRLVSRIPCILTKLGAEGVLLTEALSASDSRLSDPNLDKHVLCRKASSIKGGSSFNAPFLLPEVEESNTLEHVAGVYMRHYQIPNEIPREAIVSVNGVGDTFLGVLVAGLAQGTFSSIEDGIDYAQRAAALTLQSKDSVSPQVRSLIWE